MQNVRRPASRSRPRSDTAASEGLDAVRVRGHSQNRHRVSFPPRRSSWPYHRDRDFFRVKTPFQIFKLQPSTGPSQSPPCKYNISNYKSSISSVEVETSSRPSCKIFVREKLQIIHSRVHLVFSRGGDSRERRRGKDLQLREVFPQCHWFFPGITGLFKDHVRSEPQVFPQCHWSFPELDSLNKLGAT